jgi:hypothetical protein
MGKFIYQVALVILVHNNLARLDVMPFAKARCRNSLFNNSSKSALNSEVVLFPYLGPIVLFWLYLLQRSNYAFSLGSFCRSLPNLSAGKLQRNEQTFTENLASAGITFP